MDMTITDNTQPTGRPTWALPQPYADRIAQSVQRGEVAIPELADLLLEVADKVGASDIHVEPQADHCLVRYRCDGMLLPVVSLPKGLGENLIARFKMMARVLTYRRRAPQDGRVDAGGIGIRAAFLPVLHGEKAVLRLPVAEAPQQLHELGLADENRLKLEHVLVGGHGVVFLTGPSSSGKSTTIYAALRYILQHASIAPNIMTLEDPIEQELPGVNQTQIDPAGGLTFLAGLRSILRMAPDVIVVGEIRDDETARVAIHAGLSGHRVLTTIHSGTAAQVYSRLLHMGIEPFLLATAVSAIVAQRLARRVCSACAHERPLEPWETKVLFGQDSTQVRGVSAVGCPSCFGTGVRGRLGLFEVALPSPSVREAVLRRAQASELAQLLEAGGMRPLRQALREAVSTHVLSIEEAIRLSGGIASD